MSYTEQEFNEAMARLDGWVVMYKCDPSRFLEIESKGGKVYYEWVGPPNYYNDLNYLMPLAWKFNIEVTRWEEDTGIDNTVTEYGWCVEDFELHHVFTVSGNDPLPAIRDRLFELSQERKDD